MKEKTHFSYKKRSLCNTVFMIPVDNLEQFYDKNLNTRDEIHLSRRGVEALDEALGRVGIRNLKASFFSALGRCEDRVNIIIAVTRSNGTVGEWC